MNKILIVVVALLSATLVAGFHVEEYIRSHGLTNYDRAQLQQLVDDLGQ
jgi:hypothetical protein